MPTLFISDLHLSGDRPRITRLLCEFLEGPARRADALYILGDLFEYWIGDDAIQPDQRPVVDALRRTADTGVPVYFMHGNRDFLIGEEFSVASGCRIINEPIVIDVHGRPVLLMHGDVLCTDDRDYQQFRAMVRTAEWQRDFLSRPIAERLELAQRYRSESRSHTERKPMEIKDVNQQQVEDTMRRHGVDLLIHGHTHRPAFHNLIIDGNAARRIVLGDWHEQGSVLIADGGGYRLEDIG